ncbi:MAG: vitamin K epoxide reductase family protein [Candidatus Liptonbacteria bacterium]|nr:vitamin K epoxide reductase family protein [Candidatus Liptonbacteria bacterium]
MPLINLTPHALLFTIAAIGISETAYLIRKRIAAEVPVCPVGEGCETVLNSKYNRMFFGIHNDLLGMLFYVAFTAIAAFLVVGVEPLETWLTLGKLMLLGATLMSVIFTYLQWKVIGAWCFWCLMSAGTVALMDIIVLSARLT